MKFHDTIPKELSTFCPECKATRDIKLVSCHIDLDKKWNDFTAKTTHECIECGHQVTGSQREIISFNVHVTTEEF
jgi:hypothetical protein